MKNDSMRNIAGPVSRSILRAIGFFEYYLRPGILAAESGPFNGQSKRTAIVREILSSIKPEMIVETGTCRGSSTEFLAGFGVAVHTVELHSRFFGYCCARFRTMQNVRVYRGDSRKFLRKLAASPLYTNRRTFFYLDAHWYDLPLEEELAVIFDSWHDPIIMIDDFFIPDSDYGYDSYVDVVVGPEIVRTVAPSGTRVFVPSFSAQEERGAKRGWAIISGEKNQNDWMVQRRDIRALRY